MSLKLKDRLGFMIPDKAMPVWERSQEVITMMKHLSEIKCAIEKAKDAGDVMFVEVGNGVISDLKMCREWVSYALPYAVCPECNGQLIEKCILCRGRGVVSKELYAKVPIEIRNMREKALAKKTTK